MLSSENGFNADKSQGLPGVRLLNFKFPEFYLRSNQ
jgi:hypothetical protein